MSDLQAAIKRIETSRQTHVEWRDYWLTSTCRDCDECRRVAAIGGDLERQVRVIAEYDNVLAVLRSSAEVGARALREAADELAEAGFGYAALRLRARADALTTEGGQP